MNKQDKIYVAGHNGMVGSAIVRHLRSLGFTNLLLASSAELDLRNQAAVQHFFEQNRPDLVYLAAAKVGGIQANNIYRAEFIYDNLAIELNVIDAAYKSKVNKLLFLGSSCIYPKNAPQPMNEELLLSGFLEQTNEPYAIAKIAGIKLCEAYRDQYGCNFISAMPTNLYGPNDNYHFEHSHVLPALLRKFHDAKMNGDTSVEVWGTGNPKREFLHVDDLASACVCMMENYNEKQFLNIGFGEDISIADLAKLIMNITGYSGSIQFNTTKPDGTYRKLLDSSRLHALNWKAKIELEEGIRNTYQDFLRGLEQQVLSSR